MYASPQPSVSTSQYKIAWDCASTSIASLPIISTAPKAHYHQTPASRSPNTRHRLRPMRIPVLSCTCTCKHDLDLPPGPWTRLNGLGGGGTYFHQYTMVHSRWCQIMGSTVAYFHFQDTCTLRCAYFHLVINSSLEKFKNSRSITLIAEQGN